jgi:hypothetical protein
MALLPLLSLALVLALPLRAESADAEKLLEESEKRHRSVSQEYAGELEVIAKDGKARKKGWKSWRQGYAGDAKLLIRFVDPPEVRGVGFLSLGKPGKNPDQWLYLPSMKRERRIAAQDRDASFVGTDFNYEDMEEFDRTKYDVKVVGEEPVAGEPCWKIEARPRGDAGRSIYERKLLWLRKDVLYMAKVESFRKGEAEPAKRLLLEDLAEVDTHRVARRLVMNDVRRGSRTTIVLKKLAFDRPQPPDRFTLQNLVREGED